MSEGEGCLEEDQPNASKLTQMETTTEDEEGALDLVLSSAESQDEIEDEEIEYGDEEVCLLFLGTFDHDNSTEMNVDQIQFRENARITEVRIIPLGAEIVMDGGGCQLGATNPAEVLLEFYYNDLRIREKPTYVLLGTLDYKEKCSINVDFTGREDEVITDTILIRGEYATVTVALYGYPVSDDSIKYITPAPVEIDAEIIAGIPLEHEGCLQKFEEGDHTPIKRDPVDNKENITGVRPDPTPESEAPATPTRTPDDTLESTHQASLRVPLTVDVPQSIPTISTRVNFSPIKTLAHQAEPMEIGDNTPVKVETVSSDEDQFDEQQHSRRQESLELLPLLMETEDISDGEISDLGEETIKAPNSGYSDGMCASNRERKLSPEALRHPVKTTGTGTGKAKETLALGKTTRSQEEGSPHEVLSDQDSFGDEFADSAVEEILSDEDMPEYGEYEYGDWDEQCSVKFGRGFNPLAGSYQVHQLQTLKIDLYLRKTAGEDKFSASKLLGAISKFSESEFDSESEPLFEAWIEKMEQLLGVLPQALNAIGEEDQEVLKAVRFWIKKGLDFEFAKNQASIKFKLRYIKIGLKLVHCVCNYGGFIAEEVLKLEFDDRVSLQYKLLELVMDNQFKNIASIQALSIKTLDATLSTRLGFDMFCSGAGGAGGCQRLLNYFIENTLATRIAHAFKSLFSKINLMSNIISLEQTVQALLERENEESDSTINGVLALGSEIVTICTTTLEQLIQTTGRVGQVLAFPTRFLPADIVLELPLLSANHDPKLNLIRLLRETEFMKICAVLVNCKEGNDLAIPISELIQSLAAWEEGLVYLCSEADYVTIVIKAIVRSEEKQRGLHCAHCLEVLRCIDLLKSELEKNTLNDSDEDIQCLQQLYSFLNTSDGRDALVHTLSLGNLISPLLKCIKDADPNLERNAEKLSRLTNSARKGYALDLLVFVVKFSESFEFLKNHGSEIYDLIIGLGDHYEGYDKLKELLPFLKPSTEKLNFTYDGIESLCLIIKEQSKDILASSTLPEQNWGFNPEVITALRILKHQGIQPDEDDVTGSVHNGQHSSQTTNELKYMMAYVRMNNDDLLSQLAIMLTGIVKHFEHTAIQSFLLAGSKGDALISLLHPLIQVYRKILSKTILARNAEFRDLTPVPILAAIFALMKAFPESSLSRNRAEEVSVHIISTLMAYTIPTMKLGEESEAELKKTAWTQMILEIIKFIWMTPANFVSGLTLLSELLPFPFPIHSQLKLTLEESSELVQQKRLWSVYMHGASGQLEELIGMFCESSHPELLATLKQLCLKMADLSASTCLAICRGVMGKIMSSIEADFKKTNPQRNFDSTTCDTTTAFVKSWVEIASEDRTLYCSLRTARLLDFLASLISSHGVFKAGVMHIYRASSEPDEIYADFISMLCSILSCWPNSDLAAHTQGQRHIVTIFQAVCDVEFNMFTTGSEVGRLENVPPPDFIRINSLPLKDKLVQICSSFLIYLGSFDTNLITLKSCVSENVLHALQIISETEYGFYHLQGCLEKNTRALSYFTKKLILPLQYERSISPMIETISAYTNFLHCLVTPKEDAGNTLAIRESCLGVADLRKYLEWTQSNEVGSETQKTDQCSAGPLSSSEENQEKEGIGFRANLEKLKQVSIVADHLHPLLQLKLELEKWIANIEENADTYHIYASLEGSLETLNRLLDIITRPDKTNRAASTEVILATPSTFTEAFTRRPVFVYLEDDTPLSSCYFTSFPPSFYDDIEQSQYTELEKCDMVELAKTHGSGLELESELAAFFKKSLPSGLNELRKPTETDDLQLKSGNEFAYPRTEGFTAGLLTLSTRKPPFLSGIRGNSNRINFGRGAQTGSNRQGSHFDPFRSRPPNTSRPPSLHVDDFVAMESGSGGQSNFNKPGPRTATGRGQRGSTGRTFSNLDRGRPFRTPQTYNYQRNDGNSSNSGRGRGGRGGSGGGGREFGNGNNQRWGNSEPHTLNPGFLSGRSDSGRSNDDKFRGGPGSRSSITHTRSNIGMGSRPSFSRNFRRDSPSSSRASSSSNQNMNSSNRRWNERQRPFNR